MANNPKLCRREKHSAKSCSKLFRIEKRGICALAEKTCQSLCSKCPYIRISAKRKLRISSSDWGASQCFVSQRMITPWASLLIVQFIQNISELSFWSFSVSFEKKGRNRYPSPVSSLNQENIASVLSSMEILRLYFGSG